MKKESRAVIYFVLIAVCFNLLGACSKTAAAAIKERGITLDVARKFYTVEAIEGFIDLLADYENTFLQLHLTDDQNVAIEMAAIGQTVENGIRESDKWRNPLTGQPFLSKSELAAIVKYGNDKNVRIIPEIEAPAHMQALLEQLKNHDSNTYEKISLPKEDNRQFNTIDYSKPEAIEFMQSLLSEYLPIFSHQEAPIFHIACDEVVQLPIETNPFIVRYANTLNRFLVEKGFQARMWNDSVTQKDLERYDKDIQITYWSHTGELNVNAVSEKDWLGNRFLASPEDFINASFEILNYNGYYLYFLPSDKYFERSNYDYSIADMERNWQLDSLYLNSLENVGSLDHIIGSSLTIWGEAAHHYSDLEVLNEVSEFITAYLNLKQHH